MLDDYRGLELYPKLSYIPAEKEEEAASKTMEYVYYDWAVAHVAQAVGTTEDAKQLLDCSRNYRNLFDPKSLSSARAWKTATGLSHLSRVGSKWQLCIRQTAVRSG